ncbi:MAG TPA: SDR family oxidoreductase [Dehalococcoidia bacterium]|nr:SDR family oxidoreductase [Dehalococcoidia bacterium]
MKCVVTGGAGFIGSHLVDALVARGDEVTVIDDLSEGKREQVHPQAGFVKGSILDSAALQSLFRGVDIVFHQAALRSVPQSLERPLDYHRTNVDGTYGVLEAARQSGVSRVVFASSSSAYGDGHPLPLKEEYLPRPKSPYALSKVAGEHYMRLFFELYGLKTISLRYFNVFGPRQDPSSEYSTVIPLFIKAVNDGTLPVIYGNGKQSRDFTYVGNVVDANLLASGVKRGFGEAYNIAEGKAVTVNDLAAKVGALAGKAVKPKHLPVRAGDVLHTLADLSQAKKVLSYRPKRTFDDGLALTYNWFGPR